MIDKVFVYGTLKVGGRLATGFDDWRTESHAGRLEGALVYDLGPYPFMVKGNSKVIGELHAYREFAEVIKNMDRIEGFFPGRNRDDNYYLREKVMVRDMVTGQTVEAWAYFMNPKHAENMVRGKAPIASGIWEGPTEPNMEEEEEEWWEDEEEDQECVLEPGVLCHGCGDCERTIGRVKD
jgi:gamma-glutamylcyclotransferase (GGCT)/AIG2-like uncharacterized protein YtfP